MRICIPTFLTTSQKAGIAFYTINLINALQEVDCENEYFILTYDDNKEMFEIHNPNFHKIIIPFKERNRLHLRLFIFFYHTFLLKKFIRENNIDLVHIPSTWFVSKRIPTIITIHDIVEYKVSRYSKIFSKIKKQMVKTAISNAKCILTVSEFSKQDICSIGALPEKVLVTYNGVNETTDLRLSAQEVDELLDRYGLVAKKYFIFVGTAQLHKNIQRLIKAFCLFREKYPDYHLIIAGKKDNASPGIEKTISELNTQESILQLSYIDDKTKHVLIKEAAAFVFISLHEGFGMPILEANRYGTPLIVSNGSCMAEIAAETALYVDPLDIFDVCQKMKDIVEKSELEDRLRSAAEKNLNRFDWKETAKCTRSIYTKMKRNVPGPV
jgi:glycosyltransferase involved in cell wall biosynthesis